MASSRMHPLGNTVNEEVTDKSCRFRVLSSCIKMGEWIWFPAFITGEHFWCIVCLPQQGDVKGEIGNLRLDLYYGGEWNDVKANVGFGVLKKDEPLSSVKWITNTHTFSMSGAWFELENVVKGDGLKMYLKDDYFTVLCKITVLNTGDLGGVTILSSLTGITKRHSIKVRSLENKHIASKDSERLIDTSREIKREMKGGSFEFKIMCSQIPTGKTKLLYFPMFVFGEYCWIIYCHFSTSGDMSITVRTPSETKDLKAGIVFSVLKKDDVASPVKGKSITYTFKECNARFHMGDFIKHDELKAYLQDDYFRIICNITILSETIASDHDVTIISSTGKPMAHFTNGPSPNLRDDLSKLLQNKESFDVTFEVNGEMFHAHRFLLAARSAVFNEKLFGPTNENKMEKIKINDMEPMVFKAMLHFVYTDMLPNLNECSTDGNSQMPLIQMLQHLLSAADCYALESLKLICEDKLSNGINIDTVATTLVLAEKHNSPNLKARCIEFIISPDHFSKVALTDGYANLLMSCPKILKELRANLKNISI